MMTAVERQQSAADEARRLRLGPTIRGYPRDAAKSKHVLLLQLERHVEVAGKDSVVATVRKHMLDGSAPDKLLLNPLVDSSDLRSLMLILSRFDDLPCAASPPPHHVPTARPRCRCARRLVPRAGCQMRQLPGY